MGVEDAFYATHGDGTVHEISTVIALTTFLIEHDTGFVLTDLEAEKVLGYMEGHDYVLGEKDGNLLRGDLDEKPGEICWEPDTMDDVIDIVCEWNYELILDADAKRQNPKDFVDFSNSQDWYQSLKEDEVILDQLFEQTKYSKELDELAHNMANDLVQKITHTDNQEELIGNAVETLSEQIKEYTETGKSR